MRTNQRVHAECTHRVLAEQLFLYMYIQGGGGGGGGKNKHRGNKSIIENIRMYNEEDSECGVCGGGEGGGALCMCTKFASQRMFLLSFSSCKLCP
jgi:hypothetical protein